MDASTILNIRLANHHLLKPALCKPEELVSWMGAIQAQEYYMAKWAIGVRLANTTNKQVEDALNAGRIIRTHILRPTWHFVAAEDIHWMLRLSAPRVKTILRASDKVLELTTDFILTTNSIIRKELELESNLTRQELRARLKEAGINSDDPRRLNHIMMHAELDGVVCNGIVKGKKQTYRLLEKIVPETAIIDNDEALGKLAYKYFSSHGPATIQDFVWWSGLSTTQARRGIDIIKTDFIIESIGTQVYIYPNLPYNFSSDQQQAHLLPAFDEFLVSYRDRKEILHPDHYKKVITSNGIFSPTVNINGNITGVWKKILSRDDSALDLSHFDASDKQIQDLIANASDKLISFYE